MKLYVTVNNRPAIIVSYAPGKNGKPLAICIGLASYPIAVELNECQLPKLPKRLVKRMERQINRETRAAQEAVLQ